MKIAITGSDGYIGSTLVGKLRETDHDIYSIDINDWDIRTTPMQDGLPHHWFYFDGNSRSLVYFFYRAIF